MSYRGSQGSRGRGRGGAGQKRYGADSNGGGYGKKQKTAGENSHRFLVPADLVQGIIGRGGANIKGVLASTQEVDPEAKISIYSQGSNGEPLMDGAADRVLGIQATTAGLEKALEKIISSCQYPPTSDRRKKLELRFMAPAHTTSGVIGKGGEVVKRLKEETKSFIQVYTLPLPLSEETIVRVQNFEAEDLVRTILQVVEAVAPTKSDREIMFYTPIWFNQGDYGDTGSYIDTFWYQDAISAGRIKHTPYSGRLNHQGPNLGQASYDEWADDGGYGGGYDDGYGAGGGGRGDGYDDGYGGGRASYGSGGGNYDYGDSYSVGQGYGGGYEEDYGAHYSAPKRGRGGPRGGPRGRARGGRGY